MRLAEVIERLETLDQQATIYAARPWRPDAQAAVAVEREDGAPPSPDLDYFLEVDIAVEAATASTAASRFERVRYYAENDALLLSE